MIGRVRLVLPVKALDSIHYEHFHRTTNRFQLQTELLLQRGGQRRAIRIEYWRFLPVTRQRQAIRRKRQLEIPGAAQPSSVDYAAADISNRGKDPGKIRHGAAPELN